mgnify:CR=1 FL=1
MLKRKVTAFMDQWIRTKEKKCLVVQGARQTGKTYIIERFAEDNYEELVEIISSSFRRQWIFLAEILRWTTWLWRCGSVFRKRRSRRERP